MKPSTPAACKFFMDASLVLARIEANGMKVDEGYLDAKLAEATTKIRELTARVKADLLYAAWQKHYGKRAKICPEQLAHMLFGKDPGCLRLPYDGAYTPAKHKFQGTAANLVKVDHPIVKAYLQLMRYQKVKSTYLDGIKQEVVGGFIHPIYNNHLARTFRLSADSPNAQNIPRRNKVMEELVRPCFVPRHPDWVLSEVDFSGIEVRVGCCLHRDPAMVEYLKGHGDMHEDAACRVFLLRQDQVCKKTTRDAGKNEFVFPMFYGSFWGQAAPRLWETMTARDFRVGKDNDGLPLREHLTEHGITELGNCDPDQGDPEPGTFAAHVKAQQEWLWAERFPVYAEWKRRQWRDYQREGGFTTVTGFYCNAYSGKRGLLVKNDVTNWKIQGPSAHCMVWSLIEVEKWLRKEALKTLIVGTIHDSVIFDGPAAERDEVLHKVKAVTTVDLPRAWSWLRVVPMDVDAEAAPPGRSWFHKEKVTL